MNKWNTSRINDIFISGNSWTLFTFASPSVSLSINIITPSFQNFLVLIYSLFIDVESCALVERLLTEYIKESDKHAKLQQETKDLREEHKVSQQALIPLQKENERLTQENSHLHYDIIKSKEEADQGEYKWKHAMRQLQNERQDLKFLVD